MLKNRSSGILAHITSLPSHFGIGDVGSPSYNFIDFLVECDQSYWQFLPTGPTNSVFDDSPYMAISAFAGSPLLISPQLLIDQGLIAQTELIPHPTFSPYKTDFKTVRKYKTEILQHAYQNFEGNNDQDYQSFLKKKKYWLNDYALFMTLKEKFPDTGWQQWPTAIRIRDKNELERFRSANCDKINYYKFEQYIFYRQWNLLHKYAQKKGIILFGDLPIYIGYDSADVWANREIFFLDPKSCKPSYVSGVPPDYFSSTGQRWGNPLYNWHHENDSVQDKLFNWWFKRLSALFEQIDVARIDHFRAFESYWAIPEEEPTAVKGEWIKGPGKGFLQKISSKLGSLNIIAEDLGIITPEVEKLRDDLGFPGMKVLQFGFDGNPENNHLPHNFTTPNCITYTGTHDNDTTVGWYFSNQLNDEQRMTIKKMVNRGFHDNSLIHHDLMYLAQSSISKLTIFPLQDVLGFGNDCKMNSPGVAEGNWKWMCSSEFLTPDIAAKLKDSTRLFGRGRKNQT
jgi:4-alpha-glucanotransferase